jgi:UPF0271 protein
MITIDHADMGEPGAYRIGADEAVMTSISSATSRAAIAGDPPSRRTVLWQGSRRGGRRASGVPDLVGFGRREMRIAPKDVEDLVLTDRRARSDRFGEGIRLRVKLPVRLYNMAVKDRMLADVTAPGRRGVRSVADSLRPSNSDLARAGQAPACGLRSKDLPIGPTSRTDP